MSKFLTVSLVFCTSFVLTGCNSNNLMPEEEIDMLNTKNTPSTQIVEKMQEIEPATDTNFVRQNDFIDGSFDKVDDYANNLNQQMNELEKLR